MRRFLGQFPNLVKKINDYQPDMIISAGISGCVIAEYVRLMLEEDHNLKIPVSHMVFSRQGKLPDRGHLSSKMNEVEADKILIVEDVVDEGRTLSVMQDLLDINFNYPQYGLFSLEIATNDQINAVLAKFEKIMTFDY